MLGVSLSLLFALLLAGPTPAIPPPTPSHAASPLHNLLAAHWGPGRDAVLDRRYEEAEEIFDQATREAPESPLGPLGNMLRVSAQMLEAEDFRYDREFKTYAKVARSRLQPALAQPGDEAWDHVLAGAFYGLRGMHALRKKNYVFSVRKGLAAVRHLEQAERKGAAPADIQLGLGAYTYFRARLRTVIPWSGTPDGRERGVALITHAKEQGELVAPIAHLALLTVLLDERKPRHSAVLARDFIEAYPGNVMARIQLARGLTRLARSAEAVRHLEDAHALAPDNPLVPYYLGHAVYRSGTQLGRAQAHLEHFVARAPTDAWRAAGLERLGDVHLRQRDADAALRAWAQAQTIRSKRRVAAKIQRARDLRDRWRQADRPSS